jgi:hypothetical protein
VDMKEGPQHEERSGQPLRRCACRHLPLPFPLGPCAAVSVSVAPGGASSPASINVRSFYRLSLASSMAAGGRAIATSPASLVNGPPCPSCPFPLKKS